jgi:translocation and assembly module TamB
VSATVTARQLDVPQLLALAGNKTFPATGQVNAAAEISGTLGDPGITGDFTVNRGTFHGQPFDSITAHVQGAGPGVETVTGVAVSGPKRVNISGRFEPKGAPFPEGRVDFNVTSNTMPLNEIQAVKLRQPSIGGFGKFHAEGTLTITRDAKKALQWDLVTVSGDASLNGVSIEGRSFGDTRLTATTKGDTITAVFESTAANVRVRGDATLQLAGDYPVAATVRFNDTTISALAAIALKPETARNLSVDGVAEAEVKITGPARHPESMRAEVNVGKLEFRAASGTDVAKLAPNFVLANDGPIRAAVTKDQIRIESAKLKGPQTELSLSGGLAFAGGAPLSAQAKGQVNLALLEMFDRDLSASGMLTLDAGIKGTLEAPDVTGRAQLRNGEAHYSSFSNGLSNANGEITFNGSRATIQSLSGETGGGHIDAEGFAALSNGVVAFRLDTKARDVRVRFQDQGFSSVSNADLTLAGTSQRSLASGTVTVQRVTINPQSDAASLLALSAQPLETASVKPGLLTNMNLDIQINTAPDLVVQTSLTESLQADANLRLRGTVTSPAILGRVNVTSGALMFFGNKYTIAQGAISFFNPTKIDPVVNFDLETRARGVDVILTVAGQVNKLNVSYRSDPPLQFSEIVALLATGRTPTDATLAARDTGQAQGLAGLEASSLVSQAIANPVAGRLQRFFGVSRLKIDPRFTGITGSPQARLTIEQQVSPDVLFTYVTDVSNTSTQLVRVEWAMNRNWSALLTREENGKVGLDFSFKKRFK